MSPSRGVCLLCDLAAGSCHRLPPGTGRPFPLGLRALLELVLLRLFSGNQGSETLGVCWRRHSWMQLDPLAAPGHPRTLHSVTSAKSLWLCQVPATGSGNVDVASLGASSATPGGVGLVWAEVSACHSLRCPPHPAQRPCHQHLPGSGQAALHAGGVGQADPALLRAAPGRPGHPAAGR